MPPRDATLVELPELSPSSLEALQDGRLEVYSHQREAYERVRAGENVIVATATASGKSLCYKIPAFQNALESPRTGAPCSFTRRRPWPRTSSAKNQALGWGRPPGDLRRDTPTPCAPTSAPGERPPHQPRHAQRRPPAQPRRLGRLSSGTSELVAVDEAHVLRGVFGSHVAAVMRRLRRVAELHGGDPRFVLTSATIANPLELAESLTGPPFSARGQRRRLRGSAARRLPQPAAKGRGEGRAAEHPHRGGVVFASLVAPGVRTIAFAKSASLRS